MCGLFLSHKHLEVIVGLNFNMVVSLGIGRPKERESDGEWPVDGTVRTHTTFIS